MEIDVLVESCGILFSVTLLFIDITLILFHQIPFEFCCQVTWLDKSCCISFLAACTVVNLYLMY